MSVVGNGLGLELGLKLAPRVWVAVGLGLGLALGLKVALEVRVMVVVADGVMVDVEFGKGVPVALVSNSVEFAVALGLNDDVLNGVATTDVSDSLAEKVGLRVKVGLIVREGEFENVGMGVGAVHVGSKT